MDKVSQQYDVADLAEFMHNAKVSERPFVFFTGAGCSVTAGIPLAKELIETMHQRFKTELKLLNGDDRQDYGKCMAQIGRDDRRRFLKEYIDSAKINWAHIALACLLREGYIGRVLTFNFDNLLARSCGLLGLYPATYDFTAANLNLYHLIDNPAVVHLHGQSHGFAQLNSDEETASHAAQLSQFVCSTLNESPALFIGYSGQADAFFPQIKDNFSGQHRLFWVGRAEQAPKHLADSVLQTNLAHYMRCADGADLFLIELAQQLNCFPPAIFTDPYAHLLEEVETVTAYPQPNVHQAKSDKQSESGRSTATTTQDILQELRQRLQGAQQQEKEEQHQHPNYLDLFLQGKYQEIIQLSESGGSLSAAEQEQVARAYFNWALKQTDLEQEISVYDQLIARFGESEVPAVQERVAKAMVNKGFRLGQLDCSEDEISVYDQLIERFGVSDVPTLQEAVAKALGNKGLRLGLLGRSEDEFSVYGQLIARFDSSDVPALQEQVARALVSKGFRLGQLDRSDEAIAVYDQLIARFGESEVPALQEQVARALVNKGITLRQLDRSDEEMVVYDQLITRFGESEVPAVQEQVALALVYKGVTLGQLDHSDEAIAVYDQLIARFGESEVPELQERVAKALNGKGFILLMDAKANWDDPVQAQRQLNMALKALQQAISKACAEDLAMIVGNLAYVEFLLDQPDQAETHLREALSKGGESLYRATLDEYPTPVDVGFQALLERLWQQCKKPGQLS